MWTFFRCPSSNGPVLTPWQTLLKKLPTVKTLQMLPAHLAYPRPWIPHHLYAVSHNPPRAQFLTTRRHYSPNPCFHQHQLHIPPPCLQEDPHPNPLLSSFHPCNWTQANSSAYPLLTPAVHDFSQEYMAIVAQSRELGSFLTCRK